MNGVNRRANRPPRPSRIRNRASTQESTIDYLLRQHDYFGSSFWKSEEGGETRLRFFITLVTAVLALIGTLLTSDVHLQALGRTVTVFAVAALLLVGLLMLMRMIRPDEVTDDYKLGMDIVRMHFDSLDEGALTSYRPFLEEGGGRRFLTGGMVEIVILLNGLLVVVLVVSLGLAVDGGPIWSLAAAGAFPAAVSAQWTLARRARKASHAKIRGHRDLVRAAMIAPTEVEGTLVVRAARPQTEVDRLAKLTRVGDFELRLPRTEAMRDVYFDSKDGGLSERMVALRLRSLRGRTLLAIKGPESRANAGAGVTRLEFEAPWSLATWRRARELLSQSGVKLPASPERAAMGPRGILGRSGFTVIQERETVRDIREIVARRDPLRKRLCEMAIDRTTFFYGGRQQVKHFEIEIEAKSVEGAMAIPRAVDQLIKVSRRKLARWEHSKLATGKAIGDLLSKATRSGWLHQDGTLDPRAYKEIDRHIHQLSPL